MNQNNIISFIPDEEIILHQRTEADNGNDLLNTSTYVDALVQCIESTPTDKTFTIGLFGEWGSGKSSIVKTALNRLQTKSASDNSNVKFITYDSWKYASDSFRRMFILELQKQLNVKPLKQFEQFYDNINEDVKVKHETNNVYWYIILAFFIFLSILTICIDSIPEKLGFGLGTITALFTIWLNLKKYSTDDLKLTVQKSKLFAPEQFEDCYNEIINESRKEPALLQKILRWISPVQDKADKIIIVIDNIDRCQPDVTYTLLSDIKSFLGNSQDVIFIVPVDVNALRKHIINRSKDNNASHDADEFLRKFFNVSIWIKAFQNDEMYDFTQNINQKYSLGLNSTSVSVISREYATNPRRIIQLLNNLSIEFAHFNAEFREDHESIISLIAIIREEYPESYKKIVKNPKELINFSKDNNHECAPLLIRTKAIVQKYESKLDVLDTILSNSAVLDWLPFEVRQALFTADMKVIIDYLDSERATPEERKYRIMTCLLEDVRKAVVRQTYLPDLFGYFCTWMELYKADVLVLSDHVQLCNFIDNDKAWNQIVSEAYLSQASSLADFAVFLSNNGLPMLRESVLKQVTSWEIAADKLTEVQVNYIYTVCCKFYGKMITKDLVEAFKKLFSLSPDKAIEKTYREPSRFFTDTLITSVIDHIRLEDVGFEKNALSRFNDICKHIQLRDEKLLSTYLNKMKDIMPDYIANKAHNPAIIQVCSIVNETLEICSNIVFKKPDSLKNFIGKCLKSLQVIVNYNRTEYHNMYKDNAENSENLQELVRLFYNVQAHYTSMMLFEKDFIEFMLQNKSVSASFCESLSKLIECRCTLEQYADSLKKYQAIDNNYLNLLHYFYNDPATNTPRVDEAWLKENITKLINAILVNNDTVVADFLYRECKISSQIAKLIEEYLSQLTLQNLEKLLQTSLSSMTVEAFSNNIDSYHDNINVLSLIASQGAKSTINKLNKIIVNKLVSGNLTEGKTLINKLNYCNTKDCNMLISVIENIDDASMSKEERNGLIETLKSKNK